MSSDIIFTLCGSRRNLVEMRKAESHLELVGVMTFTMPDPLPLTIEEKMFVDKLHMGKIDRSVGIYVIDCNEDGKKYVGESTPREIDYAVKKGLFVAYHSVWKDKYQRMRLVALEWRDKYIKDRRI